MMKRFLGSVLIMILGTMSCSKNDEKTSPKTNLPNFGNVQLKNIFSDDTPKIKNKKHIVSLLNEYYQNIWGGAEMSGGFLVASGDEILIEKYKGFGRENEQMPINSATPLHIASVSKPITAMAILKLVEVDSLKLDQKINTIFPQFPYEEVSVFHLLSHRSGLPKYEYFLEKERLYPEQKFITNQEVLDFLIEKKPALARATDSGFMYCNTNYALLALIIEKITQKPFPQAMKEMLFEPLQMKNTFVFQEKDIEIATQSFYQKGHKLFPLNELDLVYGDKNIYTTPRDLLNFSKAMFSKDFLPKDLMEKVFQPYSNEKKGVNNYGLGFRMKFFDDNKKLTYHTGWWHGSNTIFIHLPNSKITIIALGNRYSRKVYSAMALSSLFEDFPFEIEKIITLGTPLEE